LPARIVADGQVALDEIDLFPIIVDERLGRVDARLEAQEAGAAAGLRRSSSVPARIFCSMPAG
jgi:hypothetical protein